MAAANTRDWVTLVQPIISKMNNSPIQCLGKLQHKSEETLPPGRATAGRARIGDGALFLTRAVILFYFSGWIAPSSIRGPQDGG